jgi:hypothetical protein
MVVSHAACVHRASIAWVEVRPRSPLPVLRVQLVIPAPFSVSVDLGECSAGRGQIPWLHEL